jgi:ABC-type glycerol-3-phosphate transport system substrate-binding protein
MKKIFQVILVFLITAILLLNCSEEQSTGSEVELVFWHSFVSSTIPALNKLVEKFEKENPGIRIKAQYVPTGDAHIQKLITAIQSKNAPDISWLHSDYLEDLVEADAIYKIDDFMQKDTSFDKSEIEHIYPALIPLSSWRGTLYSLPMEATNLALLYNKQMFRDAGLDPEKPPANWDELYNYSKKLTIDKDGDGRYDQVGFFLPVFPAAGPQSGWMVWQFYPFLWQAGTYVINEAQDKVLYNNDAGIKALSLWKKIYEELDLRNFTTDFDVTFASERLAMAMDGPWNLPRYKDLLKNLDWGFAPLPAGPSKSATVVGGEYLAVFKQSKYPDEAWEFLKWIIKPENQAFWAMESGYLPVREDVMEVPEFKKYLNKHPNFRVFVEQMSVGQANRAIDYGALHVVSHIAQAIEKATVGRMDVKKAFDEAAEKSNKTIINK